MVKRILWGRFPARLYSVLNTPDGYHLPMTSRLLVLFSSSLRMLKTKKVTWPFQDHIANNFFFSETKYLNSVTMWASESKMMISPSLLCLCYSSEYLAILCFVCIIVRCANTDEYNRRLSNPVHPDLLADSCLAAREHVVIPRCAGHTNISPSHSSSNFKLYFSS